MSSVMLHVLDEKWTDHLYDLDQLRNAIHYRSWGQKDPLVEYKQEAYTMFVDLMSDLYNTFAERFLRAQIVIEGPQGQPGDGGGAGGWGGPTGSDGGDDPRERRGFRRARRAGGERRHWSGRGAEAAGGRAQGGPKRGARSRCGARRHEPRTAGRGEHRLVERRPQRSVPVRLREEVQEVSRSDLLDAYHRRRFRRTRME